MEKYNEYKDSGVDWIGGIPREWSIKRVKEIFNIERGKFTHRPRNDEKMYSNGVYPFIQTGDVAKSNKYVTTFKQTLNENGIKVSRKFKKGTIVMTIAANIGDVAILDFDSYFPDSLVAFKTKFCTNYFYYLLSADKKALDNVKITNTQDNLNLERLNGLEKIFPPLKEQTQIANYLDAKTTAIDKKVNLLQQKIKHYKAYRKTLINKTVTKGLNKTVKLKDSGINWIGEIPEHWEVKRLKDVSKIFTGNSISDKSMFEINKDAYNYIATKDINIHTKEVNYNNGVYIPKTDKSFKITKKNTSLICLEGASAGKKLTFVDRQVAFVNKLCAIKSLDKNVFDKYIFYLLQTNLFNCQFFELLSGLIGGVSLGLLKYFNILVPALKEQQQIANYLDTKTTLIDKIVKNIETQITTLKELRKTLINEVVTGKVKVSA